LTTAGTRSFHDHSIKLRVIGIKWHILIQYSRFESTNNPTLLQGDLDYRLRGTSRENGYKSHDLLYKNLQADDGALIEEEPEAGPQINSYKQHVDN
jgi:hypothetical protein